MKAKLDENLKHQLQEAIQQYLHSHTKTEYRTRDCQSLALILEAEEYEGQRFETSADLAKAFERIFPKLESTWVRWFGVKVTQWIDTHDLIRALRAIFARELLDAVQREAKGYLAELEKIKSTDLNRVIELKDRLQQELDGAHARVESLEGELVLVTSENQRFLEENKYLKSELEKAKLRIDRVEHTNWKMENETIPALMQELLKIKEEFSQFKEHVSGIRYFRDEAACQFALTPASQSSRRQGSSLFKEKLSGGGL